MTTPDIVDAIARALNAPENAPDATTTPTTGDVAILKFDGVKYVNGAYIITGVWINGIHYVPEAIE